MIPVGWLAPSADCWDANMLRLLLDGKLYPHGLKVEHHTGYPRTEGAVIVVPGQYWHRTTDQISEAIQRYEWVLLVRTADEEDLFDICKVSHRNARWWVQTPRGDYPGARVFGVGFPPHFNELQPQPPKKIGKLFLSGQNTHQRRNECFEALKGQEWAIPTGGFTQGMPTDEYAVMMTEAKVAPAPSGAVSVDSFRFWEALASHSVPIADTVSPVDGKTGYWERLFGNAPFPIIENYSDLCGYVGDVLADWPRNANRITAWWCRQKRQYAHWLREDLEALGAL